MSTNPKYSVIMGRKVRDCVDALPHSDQRRFLILLDALRDKGPVRGTFPNYSKLGGNKHHCHLSLRQVACWEEVEKGVIKVYYVGNRENAPY